VTGSWTTRIGSASNRPLRAAFVALSATLIGGTYVPTASAELVTTQLVKDVTDTVGPTVRAVEAGANAVPSLPSTTAPAKPSGPPQAANPAPPPRTAAKPPSKEPSPSSTRADAGSETEPGPAGPPSVDGVAGAASGTVDSIVNRGSDAANGAATAERSDDRPVALAQKDGAASGSGSAAPLRKRRTASSPPFAVRAAEVAALQRWLARVWPAVSLGGGGISGAPAVDEIAGDVFRPVLAVVSGLLLASSPFPTSGEGSLAARHGVAGASQSSPAPFPQPTADDGVKVVYLIAIAGLLALLAFTVWREFRIALHPGLH
jgi:hypothetical protein